MEIIYLCNRLKNITPIQLQNNTDTQLSMLKL